MDSDVVSGTNARSRKPRGANSSPTGSTSGRGRPRKGGDNFSTVSGDGNSSLSESSFRPLGRGDALGVGRTAGFLLMKSLEILKRAGGPMYTHELQASLAKENPGATKDVEFLRKLKDNPRVNFDPLEKTWTYVCPYAFIDGPEAIEKALKDRPEYRYAGFEVTQELITQRPEVERYLTTLLTQRRVRAIRCTKPVRCRHYSSDSGFQCDLYDAPSDRCESCHTLKGVVLYALEGEWLEKGSRQLDPDLKEAWLQLPMPSLDTLLEEYNLTRKRSFLREEGGTKRRRKKPCALGQAGPTQKTSFRVNRITNRHIYSHDEFKEELMAAVTKEDEEAKA